jgi:hypothetical protein
MRGARALDLLFEIAAAILTRANHRQWPGMDGSRLLVGLRCAMEYTLAASDGKLQKGFGPGTISLSYYRANPSRNSWVAAGSICTLNPVRAPAVQTQTRKRQSFKTLVERE